MSGPDYRQQEENEQEEYHETNEDKDDGYTSNDIRAVRRRENLLRKKLRSSDKLDCEDCQQAPAIPFR